MFAKILVPLDGSPLSESVLPQVEALARLFKAQIIPLRAVRAHVLPGFDEAEAQIRQMQEAEDYIAKVESGLRARGFIDIEAATWYDDPAPAILEHARWRGVDLIAMSSQGKGGLGRHLVGSIADKVLRGASVPVLLHRPVSSDQGSPAAAYRRILVPLDGSELAETVLPQTIAIARAMVAEIILLHVVPAETLADQPIRALRSTARQRLDSVEYLELVADHVKEHGVRARTITRYGEPADQIIVSANQQDVDLIAIASHGRSALGRLIHGSVAETVVHSSVLQSLHAADVPVLVTRATNVPVNIPAIRQAVGQPS